MKYPWLTCYNGIGERKEYLLARDDGAFYVIDVDYGLNYETEEWLAQNGISEELLRELGLDYKYLPRKNVRGIAIGGWRDGDSVYLYSDAKKRSQHILKCHYDQETIDLFFGDLPRFAPPVDKRQKKRNPEFWRKEGRDPELFEQMKYVVPALTLLNTGCSLAYMFLQSWPWYLGSLLAMVAAVVLDIVFPHYFTLIPAKRGQKEQAWELVWALFPHLLIVFLSDRNWLVPKTYFTVMGICGICAALILGMLAEEFKRNKKYLFYVVFIVSVIGPCTIGHFNEAFDFSVGETHTLVVEELEHSTSRRSRFYWCGVTLPDGRKVDLDISWDLYAELEVGDPVWVEVSTGALGIEYANVYPLD